MRFLTYVVFPLDKAAELAKLGDETTTNPPEGYKTLAKYNCLSNPFPGVQLPQGTTVVVSICECDNEQAMAATNLPLMFAGATVHRIPILEIESGQASKTVDELTS